MRTRLESAGHGVHTPTLTGQGDRRHLLTPDVGIETHVRDVTEVLWFEDLHDVVLGLHSYAGVLAGPVIARSEGRVGAVVYLGAFVTSPGECLLDVEPPATAQRYRDLAAAGGDGWRVPASPAFLDQWGMTDPGLSAWVAPRLTDFPLRCCTEPTEFDASALTAVSRTYVRHTGPPLLSLEGSWRRMEADVVDVVDIACGHDMMLVAPDETARILRNAAAGRSS